MSPRGVGERKKAYQRQAEMYGKYWED